MKKTFSIFALAAAVLCSCDKNADCIPTQEPENQEPAMLNVSLAFEDESETKAVTAYTAAQDYEKAVNSVQVLVFDESGKINFYKNAGTNCQHQHQHDYRQEDRMGCDQRTGSQSCRNS